MGERDVDETISLFVLRGRLVHEVTLRLSKAPISADTKGQTPKSTHQTCVRRSRRMLVLAWTHKLHLCYYSLLFSCQANSRCRTRHAPMLTLWDLVDSTREIESAAWPVPLEYATDDCCGSRHEQLSVSAFNSCSTTRARLLWCEIERCCSHLPTSGFT